MPTVKNLTVAEDLDSEGVEPGLDSEVNLLSFRFRGSFCVGRGGEAFALGEPGSLGRGVP